MKASKDTKEILRGAEFLRSVGGSVLDDIVAVLEEETFSAGELIFAKGDTGTSMYIIAAGRIRVHDGDLLFRHMGVGDVFGEMAALDSDVRTASITADEDCTLLKLDQRAVYDLMASHPEAARAVIQGMCRKQRQMAEDVTTRSQQVRVLQRELEIGRQIQAGFLPGSLPSLEGWEFAAFFQAAREVAGDFYDAFLIKSMQHIAFIIGDVCDKGVGAALFMTLFRSLLRASSLAEDFGLWGGDAGKAHADSQQPAKRLLDSVVLTNNYIAHTHRDASMFASLFFALLDVKTGKLTYINAGHEAPFILGGSGVRCKLAPTGPVIGIMPGVDFTLGESRLERGETLFAFTDGVTEALDAHGNQFGEDRLISAVGDGDLPGGTLPERVKNCLMDYIGDADQFDDITMLSLERTAL